MRLIKFTSNKCDMLMNLDHFTYLRQISDKPHIIDKSGKVIQIDTNLNYI